MDYSAYHQQPGYDPSVQPHQPGYDPSVQPHLQYDPSAQPQHFYNQSTEDYYSYAYSNPQYVNNQSYPYHSVNVQQAQHQLQEPNPPGVTVQPPMQHDPNAYYQSLDYAAAAAYAVGPQQGGVGAGVVVAHQPIVQSSYQDTGTINSVAPPPGGAQAHIGPIPNFLGRPYHGGGRGRGRGRGRGTGRSLRNHGPAPSQEQTVFSQGGSSHVPAGPQPLPDFGPTSMPASKHSWCELCKVECNSIEILNQHKSGKKHMKNMKSLQEPQKVNSTTGSGRKIRRPSASVFNKSEVPSHPTHQTEALPSEDINQESKIGAEKEKVENKKPFWCDLCKAGCNTAEILDNHLNGKKHQKKLKIFQKSQDLNKSQKIEPSEGQMTLPAQDNHNNNNEENRVAVEKQKEQVEEFGINEKIGQNAKVDSFEGTTRGPKRKMRGGKVGKSTKPFVRSKMPVEPPMPKEVIPLVCELCNIKCESQVVFQSHLVGKKHLWNAKRFLSENETLGLEVLQVLRHVIQSLNEQTANASTSLPSQFNYQGLLAQQPVDFQATPALETTDMSQPHLFTGNFDGPTPVMANGESDAMGCLVSDGTEIVATDGTEITSEKI